MLYRIAASLAVLLLPATVFAQSNSLGGPAVAGVCMLSRDAVLANSAVGKAATARLQQLIADAQAEVTNERRPIDADVQAYQAEAPKLTPEQRRAREQGLQARLAPIEAKAQQRSREIDLTRAKALQRVASEAQPVIAKVYAAKKCGLLLDRNAVLDGNLSNDLTADVVHALDAKISTISFNRESLPGQQPAK